MPDGWGKAEKAVAIPAPKSRKDLDGRSSNGHGNRLGVTQKVAKGGAAEVDESAGGYPVAGPLPQQSVSNPDSLSLVYQVSQALRALVAQGRLWDIGQCARMLGKLCLECGLIHHRIGNEGLCWCPESDHLAKLWAFAGNAVQEGPLKVNDLVDQPACGVDGARAPTGHLYLRVL